MRSSDLQREENYNEYLRLLHDDDYYDVTYDEKSGGMSAVHKLHKFDKQKGLMGIRRGDYEIQVIEVLKKRGHRVVLESEPSSGLKKCDGLLDDIPMEIKAIEGSGTWTISTKLRDATKQHAQCVALYFPHEKLYSSFKVIDGIRLFQSSPTTGLSSIDKLLVIVGNRLVASLQKIATPIEGWSIEEGLRGQNGANPFTIPPSDAKV